MADEIVVKYKADVNGFKAEMKSAQDAIKATATEADVAGASTTKAFNDSAKSTESLRSQLKNLKAELAVATDPKDIERLARAAGEVGDKLNDANKAAKVFTTGNKFESVSTAFRQVVGDVAKLDFSGAARSAKLLQSSVQSITFKEALSGVKNLGSTLLSLGKSLLLNPVFLIGAAITAIGAAVFSLKDKIPFLTKAFDFLGKVIDDVRLAFQDFSDEFLGSTFAQEKAIKELIKSTNKYYDVLKEQADFEKSLASARGKSAEEIANISINANNEIIESHKKLVNEYNKLVKENPAAAKEMYEELIKSQELYLAAWRENEIIKAQLETDQRNESIKKQKEATEEINKNVEEERAFRAKILDIQLDNYAKANKEKLEKQKEADAEEKEIEDAMMARFNANIKQRDEAKKEEVEKSKQYLEEVQKAEEATFQASMDVINAVFQFQTDVENRKLQNFKGTDEEREKLEKEYARNQAQREKAQALFNIAIATALNIVKAGPNIPLAIAMGVIGSVQAGLVLSKPIPQFAKGTDRLKGGVKGKDSILLMAMPDEAIIKADENMSRPGLAKAWNEGRLDEYINKNFVLPKLSELVKPNGDLAENLINSSKINFPDEYALSRVMARNKGVEIQNADYLARRIAKEITSNSNIKRGWS